MIKSIKGEVYHITDKSLWIKVSNVTLEILVLNSCDYAVNNIYQLFTHFKVSEDGFKLAGFDTIEELEFFEDLLTVERVGINLALSIMNEDLETLKSYIANLDSKNLSKLKGVGQSTALNIIKRLSNKYKSYKINSEIPEKVILTLTEMGLITDKLTKQVGLTYKQDPSLTAEELLNKFL